MSSTLRSSLERYIESVLDNQDAITTEEARLRAGQASSLSTNVASTRVRPVTPVMGVAAVLAFAAAIAVAVAWLAPQGERGEGISVESAPPTAPDAISSDLRLIATYVLEMAQLGEHPAPLFDLTDLGEETELFPVDLPVLLRSREPGYSFWDVRPGEVVTILWSAAVSLEELTADQVNDPPALRAYMLIEVKSRGSGVDLSLVIDVSDFSVPGEPIGAGVGSGQVPYPPALVVVVQTDGNDGRNPNVIAIGGLPPGASVVATTLSDGTSVWQRPIDGIALFTGVAERGVYQVFDALGDEIMNIVAATHGGFQVTER